MVASDLELAVQGQDCALYAEVAQYAPEQYVLSSSVFEYRDTGCDGEVDAVWTDNYRSRSPATEASFLLEDDKYRRWLVTMAQHEGLLK